jgi:hypothetical protein
MSHPAFDFIRVNYKLNSYDIPSTDKDNYELLVLWTRIDCGCRAFADARARYRPKITQMLDALPVPSPALTGSWKEIYIS